MKSFFTCLMLACSLVSTAHASYKIAIVDVKAQQTVVKKIEAKPEDAGEIVGKTFGEVETFLKNKKIKIVGQPYVRSFEWSPNKWVFEAGFPVDKKISAEGDFTASEISLGKAAKTTHVGPYEKTEIAYKAVEDWIAKNKKEKSGAPWEVYMNSPEKTQPSHLKTEIYFPIQ